MVYWLTGQGKDPDLCHFSKHVFLVAAERQNLASLCRVLHHLREAKHHERERKCPVQSPPAGTTLPKRLHTNAEGQMPSSTAPKQRTNPGHLRTILLKIRPILSVPTVSRDCIHPLAAAYTVSYVVGFVHRFKSFSWNCRDCFFLSSQYSSVLLLFPPQSQLH